MSTNREYTLYGCSIEEFQASIEESIGFKIVGPAMILASLLSDAQVEMSHGMIDTARMTLNRAKWVISHYMLEKQHEQTQNTK